MRFPFVFCFFLPLCAAAQTAPDAGIMRIRVLQGEGAVHTAGSRASQPLGVEVTDEAGRPVEGAAVSFRLPRSGPGGLFSNGLASEIVITGADGRATVSRMRWNPVPGPFQVRVTAAKGPARAGILVSQSIAGGKGPPVAAAGETPAGGEAAPVVLPPYKPRRRWLTPVLIAAGAAAGAAGLGIAAKRQGSAASGASAPPGLSVGPPVIGIEAPK